MIYCSACGKEMGEGNSFCQHCGVRATLLPPPDHSRDAKAITDNEYATFIGRNSDKYLAKFKKFSVIGKDNFTATWHWSAFFFGPFWMLYRKLYVWAVVALVVLFIPWANLFFSVAWGIVGHYLYYKHAKNKIEEFKVSASPENLAPVLAQVGGVHIWLLKVYMALWIIAVLGIMLAIAIPQYAGYKKRVADSEALKAGQQAASNKSVNVSALNATDQGKLEPGGKYRYKEEGFSGDMVITEISSAPLTWKVIMRTASLSDDHNCTVEAIGQSVAESSQEIEANFESKAESGVSPTKFVVKFTPNTATIIVQDAGGACGVSGRFGGEWSK